MSETILYEWQQDLDAMVSGPADSRTIEYTGRGKISLAELPTSFPGEGTQVWTDAYNARTRSSPYTLCIRKTSGIYLCSFAKSFRDYRLTFRRWLDLVEEGAIDHKMTDFLARYYSPGL